MQIYDLKLIHTNYKKEKSIRWISNSMWGYALPQIITPNDDVFLSAPQVQKLQGILKPMMLRRLKEDVEKKLAPKEETIIEVELTNIQKKYYRAILEKNFSFLAKGAGQANMPNLVNTMMELRKCCNHPYLIKGRMLFTVGKLGFGRSAVRKMSSFSLLVVLTLCLIPVGIVRHTAYCVYWLLGFLPLHSAFCSHFN